MTFETEKKHRATAKGKVTKLLNRLEPLLTSEGEEAVEHEQEINDVSKALKNAVKEFNDSHAVYCKATEEAENEDEVENVMNDNEKFLSDVMTKVYKINKQIVDYNKVLRAQLEAQKVIEEAQRVIEEAKRMIPDAKLVFESTKDDYDKAKKLAQNLSTFVANKTFSDLVQSEETDSFSAENVKDQLEQSSKDHLQNVRRYEGVCLL